MRHLLTSVLLAFVMGGQTALAATTQQEDQNTTGKYSLKCGHVSMEIDAAKGGKILSLKYDDREMLSQLRWPEAFGSTFWTSPQKEWNWPPVQEFDKKPYAVEQDGQMLRMTSEVSERLKCRVGKAFTTDEQGGAIVITYTITNEGDQPRKVAPWEVTRVQNEGGLIFFDAPVDSICPAGLMDFKAQHGLAWYQTDERNENRKVNADGKGWLAYCAKGLLLVKRFDDLTSDQPAPDEAEIQVYVNRGKAHIELESQGAYQLLQPKESLSWTVRWYLMPYEGEAVPSEALVKQVRDIVGPKPDLAPVVTTTSGQVSGIMQEGSMAYLGIPYAKVERCMPPLPVEKWEGVRACDHWGPQAMQQTWGQQLSEAEMSEKNSCVLNVWTTSLTSKLKPVMVWLHGGGFDSGTSAWNPGMKLAQKDVVVVSVNHRLNILGFLDLSAVSERYKESGNVGMLDVVQALEWVRDNITRFGGDPSNVTIFGESGGGGKVGTLMCMPKAKGLFHKAIIMSGTILNVNNQEMTQQLGKAVLKELGISEKNIDKIKDVPYQQLYEAGQRAMAASIGTRKPGTPMMWGFGPTPDGEVLLQQPFQPSFPEFSAKMPVMIGTTFNELQRLQYDQPMTQEQALEQLRQTFGDETDAYVKAFAKAYPNYQPQDLVSIDWLFRPKTLITADALAAQLSPLTSHLYMYMFTWRSPVNKGSVHGHELKFCFNTLHHSPNELPQPTAEDLKLADTMSSVWAQFAHTGNPNISGLPAWQPYTAENGELMVFDHDCIIRHNPDRDLEQIIDRHCFRQLDEFRQRNHSGN
ncbi:MAG: carboxylesterase/lipase family protein [Prevotella sp.]|nr:carboxylesterase/lipase family protein [Prevotella sp.]